MNSMSSAALRIGTLALITMFLTACGGGGNSSPQSRAELSISDASASPSQTSVTVEVRLSAASTETVRVDYATLDGTALAGVDYTETRGQLSFPAGSTSENISIALLDGRDTADTKIFHLQLSQPVNATIADKTAIITLQNATDAALFSSPVYSADWGTRGVFSNAQACAQCHTASGSVMTHQGKDVSPYTNWRHDVMAHALNDPYFQATVEEETHVFPHLKPVIEDICLKCHAPMGRTHFHQTKTDPDSLYPFAQAMSENIAREGISCTACHQMKDVNLGTVESMSGGYTINTEADRDANGDLPMYGPYTAPVGQAMQNQTQYAPTFPATAHMTESRMCASCHNLYTPTLDLDGQFVTVDGAGTVAQFAEQTPYWEWLNSAYSVQGTADYKSCQACHMAEPEPGYQTPITTRPQSAPSRTPFAVHEQVGGNTQLLTMLKTYRDVLGIADSTTEAGFDAKIVETRAMLGRAASLEIGTTSATADTLSVPVTITNLTGHKLPTSFPSRRMWLHVSVKDGTGAVIFESGKPDARGRIAQDADFTAHDCLEIHKPDGFTNDGCYEPHRDVISSPEQVAIYESVLGDVNGHITHVLLHGRQYLKDNRIPPLGYKQSGLPANPAEPAKVDADIVGVSGDTNFATGFSAPSGADGKDTVSYQINVTGKTGPFSVDAELLYQSIRPSFVDSHHADSEIEGDSFVRRFKAMNEAVPPTPEVITTATSVATP
ncbi:MAG: Calx-beta domain-containing protein [Pseudomonadota bacterium]